MDYTINTPAGDFKITVEGGGWAQQDTLKSIQQLLQGKKDSISKSADDFKKELDKNNRRGILYKIKDTGDAFEDLEDELTKTEKALAGLEAALGAAGDIAGGVLQGTGKLTDINPIVDNVTGRFSKLAKVIPEVEVFGFGVNVGQAGEAATQLLRDFVKLSTTISQEVIDSFDRLMTIGIQPNVFAYDELAGQVAAAKVPLAALSEIVTQASMGIRSLGVDSEKGFEKFINSINYANNELRDEFLLLGMGTVETASFMAEFIESNRRGLQFQNMDYQQVAKSALSLTKELTVLAELTGRDVDQLREEYLAAQLTSGAQLKLARESEQFGEGFADSYKLLQSSVGPAVDQIYQIGAAVGEFGILNAIPGYVENIAAGIDAMRDDSLTAEQKQQRATDAIVKNRLLLADAFKSGQFEFAELAGAVPASELQVLADELLKGADAVAIGLAPETQEKVRNQVDEMLSGVDGINGIIGNFKETVQNMEDLTANFSETVLRGALQEGGIFDLTIQKLGEFYEALGGQLNLAPVEKNEPQNTVPDDLPESEKEKMSRAEADTEQAINWFNKWIAGPKGQIGNKFMGGQLFPGMLSMVGELGPELISMGNSMGEVINDKTTSDIMGAAQGIVEALKADVGAGGDIMSGTGLSKTMSAIESSAPMLESSMAKLGGDMQQQSVDLLTRIANDNADIKKLMNRILPKAMSGNGYF